MNNKNNLGFVLKKPLEALWKTSKTNFLFLCITGIIYSYLSVVNIYFGQNFFDAINKSEEFPFSALILKFILFGATNIFLIIINGIQNYLYFALFQLSNGKLQKDVYEKIDKIDPICFEKTEFLNHIKKAEESSQTIFETLMTVFFVITFYMPYFIFLALYLYKLEHLLLLILVFIVIAVLVPYVFETIINARFFDEAIVDKRKYEYYSDCISGREYFKETRYIGATNFFKELFKKSLNDYQYKAWKTNKKSFLIHIISALSMLVGRGIIIVYLVFLTTNNKITLGAFVAIFASLGKIIGLLDEMLNRHLAGVMKNTGLIKSYISFMRLPEVKKDALNLSTEDGYLVKVSNMSFKYPQNEAYALHNISFSIKKDETIAIVGENGSGKTTLAKLLLGIYKPTEGHIQINCSSTGVFQDFRKYKCTLKTNIIISDLYKKYVLDDLEALMKSVDLFGKYGDKTNIMLSKEFGGIDLSGGEWQRLAIARGIYRDFEFAVLDEPTASVNPIEESRLYREFTNIIDGKGAMLITHRLGSIKLADKILVLKNGSVVEWGTHNELMKKNGEYYKIYTAQAKWYKEEV